MVLTGSLYVSSVGRNLLKKVQDRRSSGFYDEKKKPATVIATEIPAQDLVKEEVCSNVSTASYWQ